MLKNTSTAVLAFIVGLVGLVGAIVLIATHTAVPPYLWAITGAALAGALGISVPNTPPAVDVAGLAEQLAPHVSIAANAGAKAGVTESATSGSAPIAAAPVTSAVLPGS